MDDTLDFLWQEINGFVPHAVALSSVDGRILSFTSKLPNLLNMTPESILNTTCRNLRSYTPGGCSNCPLETMTITGTGENLTSATNEPRMLKQLQNHIRMSCYVPSHGNKNLHVLLFYNLLSPETWNSRSILSEGKERLKESVSFTIHEINNFLTSIAGYTELLTQASSAEMPQYIRIIQAAVKSTRDILRRTQSTVNPIKSRKTWKQVDIKKAIIKSYHTAIPQLNELGVELETDFEEKDIFVWGDPVLLKQSFLNLMVNSAEAAGAHSSNPKIQITARQSNRRIIIFFKDNGPGIDPEMRNAIFETYYTTKGQTSGHGLGLSIVKKILLQHGGRIDVEKNKNEGAAFKIDLPAFG